jgi:signal transduction histidine kinase
VAKAIVTQAISQIPLPMKKRLFLFFYILAIACPRVMAQLKEIRAIQQQLPHIQDSATYVDALNRLGILFHLKSTDSCLYYVQKAKPVADRLKYAKGQAGALNNLAIVHLLKQNTYLAYKYFNSALTIYRNIKDTSNECQLLMNIGLAFATDNKMAECRKYLTAAYNAGNSLKNDSILALVILNLVSDTAMVSLDSANNLLNRAENISTRFNDNRCLTVIKQMKGENLIRAGKKADGLQMMQNALQMATDADIEYEKISVDADLGDILLAEKDTINAIKYYKEALETAGANGYSGLQIIITQKLYDYYKGRKDLRNSAIYAAILVKDYQDYESATQQSGADYMDFSIKTAELETLKNDSRKNLYIIITLSVLSLIIIILLLIVLRAQRSRKKYVELLKQRNEQAGSRNAELHYKNEFNNRLISLLAHDFRQPLAAVKGMMSLLKEPGSLSEKEMTVLINRIENSSETSLEIFDNILHWIKKQVSGFVYQPVNMELKYLVDEAAKSLQYITDKFGITVQNNVADAVIVHADKEMLQFINRNLIHNAIKFSPSNAGITVTASRTGNEMIVAVKDEGKGMTKEKLDSLFNIFSKTQYASDKEKGSGVALVICRDFLERMNGRIWAESEPGKGATFLYALPLET